MEAVVDVYATAFEQGLISRDMALQAAAFVVVVVPDAHAYLAARFALADWRLAIRRGEAPPKGWRLRLDENIAPYFPTLETSPSQAATRDAPRDDGAAPVEPPAKVEVAATTAVATDHHAMQHPEGISVDGDSPTPVENTQDATMRTGEGGKGPTEATNRDTTESARCTSHDVTRASRPAPVEPIVHDTTKDDVEQGEPPTDSSGAGRVGEDTATPATQKEEQPRAGVESVQQYAPISRGAAAHATEHDAGLPEAATGGAAGQFYTIERAAPILDTTPAALRAQLQRRVLKHGLTDAGIDLGGGIVAFKIGTRSWRLWIPLR